MASATIFQVTWLPTPESQPVVLYFRDGANIESTLSSWYPAHPPATWSDPIPISVPVGKSLWNLCVDTESS
jgi:hypothetical protein